MKVQIDNEAVGIDVESQGKLRLSFLAEDKNEEIFLAYLCHDQTTAIRSSEAGIEWEQAFAILPANSRVKNKL